LEAIQDFDERPQDETTTTTSFLGLICMLISMCFEACLRISEEYFFQDYILDPLFVVGVEGLWGTLIMAIFLPIMQAIDCTGPLCNNGHLENTSVAFKELISHPLALLCSVIFIFTFSTLNFMEVAVTKYASATQTSIISCCNFAITWIITMTVGWVEFRIS
jgi:hypothetical protein